LLPSYVEAGLTDETDETQAPRAEVRDWWFCNFGAHYYIAGRWMVHTGSGVSPVAGNILHHAVEMFLKAALVPLSTSQLKDLSHNLVKLWGAFKAKVADPLLDRYDGAIERLHAFEEIRYPDKLAAGPLMLVVNPGDSTVPSGSYSGYHLAVREVDELVITVLQAGKVTPSWWVTMLSEQARHALVDRNEQAEAWESLIAEWERHLTRPRR
jgi:hypothetical protein